MWYCWNENEQFQNWDTTSFKYSCPILSASWRCRIEAVLHWDSKILELGSGTSLSILGSSDERQDEELDVRSGKASAVTWALYQSVILKRKLLKTVKLSVFKSIFVPILTYCHESWVITEKMRSQMQASEMTFLQNIKGYLIKFWQAIRESFNIELLLLRVERSQLRCLAM